MTLIWANMAGTRINWNKTNSEARLASDEMNVVRDMSVTATIGIAYAWHNPTSDLAIAWVISMIVQITAIMSDYIRTATTGICIISLTAGLATKWPKQVSRMNATTIAWTMVASVMSTGDPGLCAQVGLWMTMIAGPGINDKIARKTRSGLRVLRETLACTTKRIGSQGKQTKTHEITQEGQAETTKHGERRVAPVLMNSTEDVALVHNTASKISGNNYLRWPTRTVTVTADTGVIARTIATEIAPDTEKTIIKYMGTRDETEYWQGILQDRDPHRQFHVITDGMAALWNMGDIPEADWEKHLEKVVQTNMYGMFCGGDGYRSGETTTLTPRRRQQR